MRKYLLPKNGQFYKANLHSHSTVSDGANTSKEMKDYYKQHGYQILALTDHELLVEHSELNDDDFLMLSGYEYAFIKDEDYFKSRTIELNLYPRRPDNVTQVCFHPRYVVHGEKWRTKTLSYTGTLFEREYTVECIQQVIDQARKNGFIVSLNHPSYSMETPEFFGKLEGLFAMEIHNQGSFYGSSEYNAQMYDQMLRMGHCISTIAADDNHRAYVYDDEVDKRPWGFCMIKADKLEYDSIIQAMEKGDMYSSQGPEIYDLYVEDGQIYLQCSNVKVIIMHTKYRNNEAKIAPAGQDIDSAVFNLPNDEYVWFEIIDQYGRHANTRAYMTAELFVLKDKNDIAG